MTKKTALWRHTFREAISVPLSGFFGNTHKHVGAIIYERIPESSAIWVQKGGSLGRVPKGPIREGVHHEYRPYLSVSDGGNQRRPE